MLVVASVAVFVIAYALIASEKVDRIAVAVGGAALMVVIGATNAHNIFYEHETGIDWGVIFLLLGMMLIVSVIQTTGVFEYLAVKAIQLAKGNPKTTFIYIVTLVALLSTMLNNVTTIMLVIPMTLVTARKLKVSPVPFILGEVFASNIGGAGTLVGDPPNIIIGSKAGIDFVEFATHMGPIALIAHVATVLLMLVLFRTKLRNNPEDRAAALNDDARSHITDVSLMVKSIVVLSGVIIVFLLPDLIPVDPALVALIGSGVLILIGKVSAPVFTKDVEWGTLIFFAGLFIMVGALVNVGALEMFADYLKGVLGDDPRVVGSIVLGASGVLSGIVDNIPYVASMTPVIADLSASLPLEPHNNFLWWALAVGADFGGNLTLVGASANIVAVALAGKAGVDIKFWEFAKYGIPVTLVSLAVSLPYLLLRYPF